MLKSLTNRKYYTTYASTITLILYCIRCPLIRELTGQPWSQHADAETFLFHTGCGRLLIHILSASVSQLSLLFSMLALASPILMSQTRILRLSVLWGAVVCPVAFVCFKALSLSEIHISPKPSGKPLEEKQQLKFFQSFAGDP